MKLRMRILKRVFAVSAIMAAFVVPVVTVTIIAIAPPARAQIEPVNPSGQAPPASSDQAPPAAGRSSRRAIMVQRMIAACSGKAVNDPCSITRANGKTVDGTCQNKHHTQLVCMPPHHHHHGAMGGMSGMNNDMGGGHMVAPDSSPSPTGQ